MKLLVFSVLFAISDRERSGDKKFTPELDLYLSLIIQFYSQFLVATSWSASL